MRSFRGVSIERNAHNGMYVAYPECGRHNDHLVRIMCDTIADMRVSIRGVQTSGCGFAGYGAY